MLWTLLGLFLFTQLDFMLSGGCSFFILLLYQLLARHKSLKETLLQLNRKQLVVCALGSEALHLSGAAVLINIFQHLFHPEAWVLTLLIALILLAAIVKQYTLFRYLKQMQQEL